MNSIINLLCGIGLFLTGMTLMSESVHETFSVKLKSILANLTKTKTKAVLTGLLVTGAIQSSSAVTVMVVSFVDNAIMSLSQAVGIVMGANIGTTVTSLLIAFNFSAFAPLSIFIGTIMKMFSSKQKTQASGMLLIGFGVLFLGMNTMSSSFHSLKENENFLSIVSQTEGKFSSVLAGFILTAVMQSSSATVGILQALALQGIVTTNTALYIILGQNIGAVIPVILSCIGRSRGARQTAVIHLAFNTIGTVIFMILMEFIPVSNMLDNISNPSMRVSAFHIIFNVVTTLIMLPFSEYLIKTSQIFTEFSLIKAKKVHRENTMDLRA